MVVYRKLPLQYISSEKWSIECGFPSLKIMFRAILAWLLTNEKWDEIIFERTIKRLCLIFINVNWELTRNSEFCDFNLSEKSYFGLFFAKKIWSVKRCLNIEKSYLDLEFIIRSGEHLTKGCQNNIGAHIVEGNLFY